MLFNCLWLKTLFTFYFDVQLLRTENYAARNGYDEGLRGRVMDKGNDEGFRGRVTR